MNIGFVGLGVMGLAMARNLVRKSGQPVTGYDVRPERMEMLVKDGGKAAPDPATLYAGSDVVCISVMTDEQLTATAEAIFASARPGTVIVDLGSSSVATVRALYGRAKSCGMFFLDSPVSGGDVGAIEGKLVIMVGGDREAFDKVHPLLDCMGRKATYMGGSECGSVAKLANNMIVAIILGAIGEAFAYGVKGGLDPAVLFEAISDGSAANFLMSIKVPKIVSRDFSPNAWAPILQKDLGNVTAFADQMGVKIPLTSMIVDYYRQLEEMGLMNEDHCNVVHIYERDMGVVVKSPPDGKQ